MQSNLIRHLVVTDVLLAVAIIVYDLLALLLPIVFLHLVSALVVVVIIDLAIVAKLTLVSHHHFGANR